MFVLFENPTVDSLLQEREGQLFDRKGGRINWTHLTEVIIGFANADGGVIVLGIEKDKTITGVDDIGIKTAEIRKAVSSRVVPPIGIEIKPIPCKSHKNEETNLLLIEVRQGADMHANLKGEVFLRIGDENQKLNHEQITLLLDDRSKKSFELMDAEGATISDTSTEAFEEYKQILGLPGISSEDLLTGRDLARKTDHKFIINMAGILLFGKNPERWVERARIRILRYEGAAEKTGQEYNVIKDVPIYGPLPYQIKRAQEILGGMLREFTILDPSGKFITQPEYPDYAWKEAITNAVVHRSYAMRGADIQIKMFDDHLEIISPGRFPGPVNETNIKDTHYSRNPRVARVASELGFVRELGEGVNRIIDATEAAKLPPPIFTEKSASEVHVRLENNVQSRTLRRELKDTRIFLDKEVYQSLAAIERKIVDFVFEHGKISTKECEELIKKHRMTASRYLVALSKKGMLTRVGERGPKVHYVLGYRLTAQKEKVSNIKKVELHTQTSLFPKKSHYSS